MSGSLSWYLVYLKLSSSISSCGRKRRIVEVRQREWVWNWWSGLPKATWWVDINKTSRQASWLLQEQGFPFLALLRVCGSRGKSIAHSKTPIYSITKTAQQDACVFLLLSNHLFTGCCMSQIDECQAPEKVTRQKWRRFFISPAYFRSKHKNPRDKLYCF